MVDLMELGTEPASETEDLFVGKGDLDLWRIDDRLREAEISDADYIIDICDRILDTRSARGRLLFFRTDESDWSGAESLRLDAYYEDLGLAIDVRRRGRDCDVTLFLKLARLGLKLVVISCKDFEQEELSQKLMRSPYDFNVVRQLLSASGVKSARGQRIESSLS